MTRLDATATTQGSVRCERKTLVPRAEVLICGNPVYWRPKVRNARRERFKESLSFEERLRACPDISEVVV